MVPPPVVAVDRAISVTVSDVVVRSVTAPKTTLPSIAVSWIVQIGLYELDVMGKPPEEENVILAVQWLPRAPAAKEQPGAWTT
jgi:hypothetical protein